MGILPLTPGLLISMAMRLDHSFGFHAGSLMIFSENENLVDKQIRLIRNVAQTYNVLKDIVESGKVYRFNGTNAQLFEEMTGEGFYKPELENHYRHIATQEALREAFQIAEAKVTYDGPQPTVTVVEANPNAVVHGWTPPTNNSGYSEFMFYA